MCSYGGSVAAVRMALSVDDICFAQIEVEAYYRLQQLQGKHVPQLVGYGQSGQAFFVATSYIEVSSMHCCLSIMHQLQYHCIQHWHGCAKLCLQMAVLAEQ